MFINLNKFLVNCNGVFFLQNIAWKLKTEENEFLIIYIQQRIFNFRKDEREKKLVITF